MENLRTESHISKGQIYLQKYNNIQQVKFQNLIFIAPEGEEAKEDSCHYIYLCKKKPDADKVAAENWPIVEAKLKQSEEEEKAAYIDEDPNFNIDEDEEGDEKVEAAAEATGDGTKQ